MSDPSVNAIRAEFIERTGLTCQGEGMPRIAGRLFGMLIFDGEAVSFGDLATQLQVSRASISTSIRILEEQGLIKRTTKPGERQDYFQLAPNPYATMMERFQKSANATHSDIEQTMAALPSDAEAIGRLQEYADFYGSMKSAINMALSELKTN